jgi:hypothetical protein
MFSSFKKIFKPQSRAWKPKYFFKAY